LFDLQQRSLFTKENVMSDTWWDDPTQTTPPPDALLVEPRGDDHWEFVYPRLTLTIYDFFEDAIEAWRVGNVEYAEGRYRRLLSDYPEFIDVYHHLAMLLDEAGQEAEAFALWQHVGKIGLECLPEEIRSGSGSLPWLFLDNRPFLRAYHGVALEIRERGEVETALDAFLRLLAWNPNDNQGVRALAVDCYFRLNQPEGVLEICELFPDDGMEGVLFGRPLALYQVGEIERAREMLALSTGKCMDAIGMRPPALLTCCARCWVTCPIRRPDAGTPVMIFLTTGRLAAIHRAHQRFGERNFALG
jgi:tetratricopeptide (TPR) repeat protein